VLPELDAVIAIQSETSNMQSELNLIWDYLLPAIKKNKLPDDPKSQINLKAKLSTLALLPPSGSHSAFTANNNFNRYFILDPNTNHIESLSIHIKDSVCHFILNTGNDSYNLYYGAGSWKTGQTNKPGPYLVSAAKENWALLAPYKIAGNFFWQNEQTLVLEMRYIESPHTEIITCHFDGKKIIVDVERSFDYGSKKSTMNGILK
jgi:hypothetical protein